jgi:hypothetical protein
LKSKVLAKQKQPGNIVIYCNYQLARQTVASWLAGPHFPGRLAMALSPTGALTINVIHGKTSHILLKNATDFPDLGNAAGQIKSATISDSINTGITFDVTPVAVQQNKKRLCLRIKCKRRGSFGDPTDGQLSINLQVVNADGVTTTDVPVVNNVTPEYVVDPGGP